MSYDAMVFAPEAAPREKSEFLAWYGEQTEWNEEGTYDDPVRSAPALREWFLEMIKTFPAMNGPYATESIDDPRSADYGIGAHIIYAGFAWSVAEEAQKSMFELARKHGLGFFNASGSDDEIFFPVRGEMVRIEDLVTEGVPKRKWKFW